MTAAVATTTALCALPTAAPAAVQNGLVAFSSNMQAGDHDIYTMSADGSNQTRISSPMAGVTDGAPSWSFDGTKMAFYSYRDGFGGKAEVYVMNADGSGQARVRTNQNFRDDEATWSPDGTRIAYASDEGGNYDIWVMNANGTNATRLTSAAGAEHYPSWSPDGSRIVFRRNDGNDNEIYVMNADGSGQTASTASNTDEDHPSWSLDGTKIVFDWGTADKAIAYFDANGQNRVNLTSTAGLYDSEDPVFSPDGTKIAFQSTRDGDYDIYVVNTDNTGLTALTSNALNDLAPSWQTIPIPDPASSTPQQPPQAGTTSDTEAPEVKISKRKLSRRARRIRGTVSDASAIAKVKLALEVKKGKRCRTLASRVLRRKPCGSPRYRKVLSSGSRWSFRLSKRQLRTLRRSGQRVRVYVVATDSARNSSKPVRRWLRLA